MGWWNQAACIDSPFVFEVDQHNHIGKSHPCPDCRQAVDMCNSCPVQAECFLEGANTDDRYHIRAGTIVVGKSYGKANYASKCGNPECGLPVTTGEVTCSKRCRSIMFALWTTPRDVSSLRGHGSGANRENNNGVSGLVSRALT